MDRGNALRIGAFPLYPTEEHHCIDTGCVGDVAP